MNTEQQTQSLSAKLLTVLTNIILKGKIYIPKKYISLAAYVVLPGVLLVQYFILRGDHYYSDLGERAEQLLLIVMFLKPASVLLRKIGLLRTGLAYRRQLGVATFYFAFFHVLGYAAVIETPAWVAFIDSLGTPFLDLWYGALALAVMFMLYITSNRISQKTFGKAWKWIQRAGYVLLSLVYVHSGLVEGDGIGTAVVVTVAFIAAKVAEYAVRKHRKKKRSAAPK